MMSIEFGLKDIIDIVLVTILFFQIYLLFRGTRVNNIIIGIISLVIIWFFVVYIFQFELLGAILNKVMSVGVIALIIIFQPEIRRFFFQLGSRNRWKLGRRLIALFRPKESAHIDEEAISQIVIACRHLAKSKTGALMVFVRHDNLTDIIQVGERIDANINAPLIENIFFKNSPLHDGAIIIDHQRINSAGTILPISQNREIPKELGLRHRAAIGITERSDAVTVVVSEERGAISCVQEGEIRINISPEELQKVLMESGALVSSQ